MYIWFCCPEVKCCCFCTRSLRLATALICIWAILISCHEVRLVLRPSCSNLYDNDTGDLYGPLVALKWVVFFAAIAVFISSSALLVFGVFFHRGITADIFIVTGLLSIFASVPYVVLSVSQMWEFADCSFNINDILIMSLYNSCWLYFLTVVASYRRQMCNCQSAAYIANTEGSEI